MVQTRIGWIGGEVSVEPSQKSHEGEISSEGGKQEGKGMNYAKKYENS